MFLIQAGNDDKHYVIQTPSVVVVPAFLTHAKNRVCSQPRTSTKGIRLRVVLICFNYPNFFICLPRKVKLDDRNQETTDSYENSKDVIEPNS